MKFYAFGFIAVLLATPVSAQNSSTTCFNAGQFVNCNTTTQPSNNGAPYDYYRALRQGQEDRAREQQYQLQMQQQMQANQEAQVRASHDAAIADIKHYAIKQLQENNCKGAIETALSTGDIDFAASVKGFCVKP